MIHFFSENDFVLHNVDKITQWIQKIVQHHQAEITEIQYIFCDDDYLLKINQDFLQHDYYTDIITFDNSVGKKIEGDIYISTDRVKENALEYNVPFEEELNRVLIHGILHLLGFKDKTDEEQNYMTQKENEALSLL